MRYDVSPIDVIDEKTLTELRDECIALLEMFFTEAHKTCSMLGEYRAKRPTKDEYRALVDQQMRETDLNARYRRTREKFFQLVTGAD